jgi:glycosyltransferase involved in cell wall biosynthesis
LPVRDAEEVLDEALDSVLGQSLEALEVLAVDDGSSDGSLARLRARAEGDPRLRVVARAPEGIVPALEAGRARARAPFLARMDADDRAEPVRLEEQLRWMEAHPEAVGCGTHVRYFPRDGLGGGARRYEAWLNAMRTAQDVDRNFWVECPLAHPTLFVRARAVAAVGGYRDREWPEDYDLLFRLRERGPLGVVPRVLLHWREGTTRLSRTSSVYAPDAFRRVKLHYLRRGPLKERDGLLVWGAGPVGKAFARAALGLGISVRAFVDIDPRKIGQTVHGAPVVPPEAVDRFRGSFGVAAVGQEGARQEIRRAFDAAGWAEGRDFVAVA